ncbi:hypothetical protein R3P38DRAFT_2763266 [Favolaschia claudopus]|uniref:Uncharacterized protein n=1 Tax=Favolaschia claudopus TaxID=2862362 RepID=A0AAW0DFV7_9AGAR
MDVFLAGENSRAAILTFENRRCYSESAGGQGNTIIPPRFDILAVQLLTVVTRGVEVARCDEGGVNGTGVVDSSVRGPRDGDGVAVDLESERTARSRRADDVHKKGRQNELNEEDVEGKERLGVELAGRVNVDVGRKVKVRAESRELPRCHCPNSRPSSNSDSGFAAESLREIAMKSGEIYNELGQYASAAGYRIQSRGHYQKWGCNIRQAISRPLLGSTRGTEPETEFEFNTGSYEFAEPQIAVQFKDWHGSNP